MYTRCPQCETIFVVSDAQLRARDRLVRCGRCLKVFEAEQYIHRGKEVRAAEQEEIVLSSEPEMATETITERAFSRQTTADYPDTGELPTLAELLWGEKRSRTRPIFWFSAGLFLLLVLLAQITWFFATELSRQPKLGAWIDQFCAYTGCVVLPQRDIGLIELSRARVSPHPKYSNALRVKGSLINRAGFNQEFPLIEVSLSNRRGEIIARRAFSRKRYLSGENADETTMLPNVRFPVLIEFINPDTSASGFEVRLVAPPYPKNDDTIFTRFLSK